MLSQNMTENEVRWILPFRLVVENRALDVRPMSADDILTRERRALDALDGIRGNR